MEELKEILKKINGNEVWDFRISEATGSIISFEIGKKIESKRKGRDFEGDYSIMIYCSWKIIKNGTILVTSNDDIELLKKGINSIVNQKIQNIALNNYGDLEINFKENNYAFLIFSDLSFEGEFDCNWFIRVDKKYYSLNNKGKLEIE